MQDNMMRSTLAVRFGILIAALSVCGSAQASFYEKCVLYGALVAPPERRATNLAIEIRTSAALNLPGSHRQCSYWIGRTLQADIPADQWQLTTGNKVLISYAYWDSLCADPQDVCSGSQASLLAVDP